MHVQSCCFACINLLLFSVLVSVAVVVPIVVIKKFCCHGNVKSHFSLFQQHISLANKEMSDFKHSVSKIVNPDQKISRKSQY